MLIVEDPTVPVKCRTTIKALFLHLEIMLGEFRDYAWEI
jgi:uncharacterized protein (UPF0147 family)